MEITVSMRAQRKFRGLPRYCPFDGGKTESLDDNLVRLAEGESVVGIYENFPASAEGSILITDRGLHVGRGDAGFFIPYMAMTATEVEGGKTSVGAGRVAIRLRGGAMVLIPVTGGDPTIGTKDAFSMLMFLDAVIADLGRQVSIPLDAAAGVELIPPHATHHAGT